MENLMSIAAEWWDVLAAIVVVASLVANKTNTEADNKVIAFLSKLINLAALNIDKLKK